MVTRPGPLPDSLGEGFSVRAAVREGVTPGRLRGTDLAVPFRGTRLRSTPHVSPTSDPHAYAHEAEVLRAEIIRRAYAYRSIAPRHAFFCCVTAAVLWGLPLPNRVLRAGSSVSRRADANLNDPVPPFIDVGVVAPHRATRTQGTRGHQLTAQLIRVRATRGTQLTDPATTWVLLAAHLSVEELIILGDAIVHEPRARGMRRGAPGSGLGTLKQLEAALNAGRRIGGTKARAALARIRVGSASPPETLTRLALVDAGLPEPALDVDVFAADGRAIGYTELAYVAQRILIEYEGDHHRTDRHQWDRDIEKHAACVEAGWTVIRLTSRHLRPSPAPAVARIRAALMAAGWRP